MAEIKPDIETFAKIKVVGIGGSGNASINRMIASKIRGVEFVAMNTDVQALHHSQAQHKLHIGKTVTRGLGAGMDPEVGQRAAEESQNEIRELLKGTDMVFVTCGLGGGTGTGAGPYIASIAKELGALTVGVVTKPFAFEGAQRKAIADQGYDRMVANVDTIITIPNDRILQIIDRKTSLLEAFETVDDVLRQGVQGISELITVPGLINVDFADVRATMANRGSALMGIGRGHGDNRAADAAKAAIASPLLEVSIDGAKAILFVITGGSNLGMYEVSEAAKIITQSADPQARVIFGTTIDETMKDEIRITVIATGFDKGLNKSSSRTVLSATPSVSIPASSPAPAPKPQAPIPQVAPLERMPVNDPKPQAIPVQPQPQHGGFFSNIMHNLGGTHAEQSPQAQVPKAEPVAPAPAPAQPHVSKPVYAPINQEPPKPAIPQPAPKKAASEEDEFDIPTFIRKKMM